jgi:hypothetical protein
MLLSRSEDGSLRISRVIRGWVGAERARPDARWYRVATAKLHAAYIPTGKTVDQRRTS